MWRAPTAQRARRISSASMPRSSCATGAGSTPRAAIRCRTRAASCWRRWCRSPTLAAAQRSRSLRSAAPSNGRNEGGLARRISHRRANGPGRELVLAVAELLGLGLVSRCSPQHELEEALAGLRDGFVAVDDRAAVEIHVFFLVDEEPRVRGQ